MNNEQAKQDFINSLGNPLSQPDRVNLMMQEKPKINVFYINTLRKLLSQYKTKEISLSKFVEILNDKATSIDALERYKNESPATLTKSVEDVWDNHSRSIPEEFEGELGEILEDYPEINFVAGKEIMLKEDFVEAVKELTEPFDVQKFMNDNQKWADKTFGKLPLVGILNHLYEEIKELLEVADHAETFGTENPSLLELADCYILLLRVTGMLGHSFETLNNAANNKMLINRKRDWSKINDKGYSKHTNKEEK